MILSSHERTTISLLEPVPDQTGRKESVFLLDAMSVMPRASKSVTSGLQSLIDVPNFREQRGKLLVLEAKGKNLLRVDAA